MSFSVLRVTGQFCTRLTRFDLPKRLISIFFFYLILAVCGASLVFYWYLSSAPVLYPPVFIPQLILNFMSAQLLWWGCIVLEAVLLVRGLRGKLLSRYPAFYAYILFVWLQALVRFFVFHASPRLYSSTYWFTELLGVVIGCGVVFEVYRVGLSAYPGTARMARTLLCFVFLLALTEAIVDSSNEMQWRLIVSILEIERALRTVQALALGALVALFRFYSIPFGRNLRGILLGYGLFIGESIIWLAFASWSGEKFSDFWVTFHQTFYFGVLSLCVTHLWSHQPQEQPETQVMLERDYKRLAKGAKTGIRNFRHLLSGHRSFTI